MQIHCVTQNEIQIPTFCPSFTNKK